MPLQILPSRGADMYREAVVERAAYAPAPFNAILMPEGQAPPNILDVRAEGLRHELNQPGVVSYKLIDTDIEGDESEQAIAFAMWVVYDQDHPYVPRPGPELPSGANKEAFALLCVGIAEMKEKCMGDKPHIFLRSLRTDPQHQGRGAGKMLVKKCIEESERRNLPIYLDSSMPGHKLYLKQGFRDVGECLTDFSKWGMTEKHWNWAMIRDP
ncbi:hypothetical protein BD289DRAFT_421098 [Coniella lustricola]|uniref:N-acetyltransferase domain-containing protein n=1 Tax=Coniella lustricola TaxID=2025994 RepID=A0A2T3AM01_9PEZI|nr:hypothetical protein BD289DRAFT_421098 [Coniella lustricola]